MKWQKKNENPFKASVCMCRDIAVNPRQIKAQMLDGRRAVGRDMCREPHIDNY